MNICKIIFLSFASCIFSGAFHPGLCVDKETKLAINNAEVKKYLFQVASRTKRSFGTAPASAEIWIYRSGLVLNTTALSEGRPIHATCNNDSAYLNRFCQIELGAWMGTPFRRYPKVLGNSCLVRVSLDTTISNRTALLSKAELVHMYREISTLTTMMPKTFARYQI